MGAGRSPSQEKLHQRPLGPCYPALGPGPSGLSGMEQSLGLPTGETLPRGNSFLISSGFPAYFHLPPPLPHSLLGAMESHVTPSLKHAWFCLGTNEEGQDRGIRGDVGTQRSSLEDFLEEETL